MEAEHMRRERKEANFPLRLSSFHLHSKRKQDICFCPVSRNETSGEQSTYGTFETGGSEGRRGGAGAGRRQEEEKEVTGGKEEEDGNERKKINVAVFLSLTSRVACTT